MPASALDVFGQLRTLTEQAGREPAEVGIEVGVSMGSGTEADWARKTRFWKEAGCSHVTRRRTSTAATTAASPAARWATT